MSYNNIKVDSLLVDEFEQKLSCAIEYRGFMLGEQYQFEDINKKEDWKIKESLKYQVVDA